MTVKKFNEVFSKVSLSNDIRKAFDDADVTSMKIYKKERIIDVQLELPDIINDSYIDAVKKQLYTQLPGIKEVLLKVRYINAGADISRSIEESWENIISAVSKESLPAEL